MTDRGQNKKFDFFPSFFFPPTTNIRVDFTNWVEWRPSRLVTATQDAREAAGSLESSHPAMPAREDTPARGKGVGGGGGRCWLGGGAKLQKTRRDKRARSLFGDLEQTGTLSR